MVSDVSIWLQNLKSNIYLAFNSGLGVLSLVIAYVLHAPTDDMGPFWLKAEVSLSSIWANQSLSSNWPV